MNFQFAVYRVYSGEHNRYEQFISEVTDNQKLESWTATSKFNIGDFVFFYFGVPFKSIITIGIVSSEPANLPEEFPDEFDWTHKENVYFSDFFPVWLLKNPIKLPTNNQTLQEWYSKAPYRSTRQLDINIGNLILDEIEKNNPEVRKYKKLHDLFKMKDDYNLERLKVEDYKDAFKIIKNRISDSDKKMLKSNLEAPNFTLTASRLAKIMKFVNYNEANLRYGSLARKLCDHFIIRPTENLSILVYFTKINKEWHWTLREKVIEAIIELGWFSDHKISNIISEVEKFKTDLGLIQNTTKEALIQSRIGQGVFRVNLIKFWEGCSVTGCQFFDILRASHIKPWRYSNNEERLDVFNGLLLMPNLDILFDNGYISFDDKGEILLSPFFDKKYWETLNITKGLKLRHLDESHKPYLQFHRENLFQT